MAQVEPKMTAICPYTILGVKHGASRQEIDAAYERLIKALDEENFSDDPQSLVQARQSYLAVENAYIRIVNGDDEDQEAEAYDAQESTPKLGQMLVAEGVITLEQLQETIADQTQEKLPLGEILVKHSLLNQQDLDSFLLRQGGITLPADSPHHLGQRLMGMGLITEDMLRIALVEQRNAAEPLGSILVQHCWLASDILEALLKNIEVTGEQHCAAH